MALWLAPDPLVLASKSEVRRTLLTAAGIPVLSTSASIDERAVERQSGAQDPAEVAMVLACAKASSVAAKNGGRMVLGADQTLALGADRFSKPASISAAREQLLALRGKTHTLHSAIAVVREGDILFQHNDAARLTMRNFSESFLDRYLATVGDKVLTSVGAYQLEGPGIQLFEKVEGEHTTILGLPLLPLLHWLRKRGLLAE